MTRKLIDSVISFSKDIVRNSLDNKIDLNHSETYSFQLSIINPRSELAKDEGKNNKVVKVQNPYMDNTSLRKGSYFNVKLNREILDYNILTLWTYAHECFRTPKGVHWVSNMIWMGSYESSGKLSDISNKITIVFPLRVLLPDLDLKQHFKCAKLTTRSDQETVKLYKIKDLDETKGDVECQFSNIKRDEFLTVVYTSDISQFQ